MSYFLHASAVTVTIIVLWISTCPVKLLYNLAVLPCPPGSTCILIPITASYTLIIKSNFKSLNKLNQCALLSRICFNCPTNVIECPNIRLILCIQNSEKIQLKLSVETHIYKLFIYLSISQKLHETLSKRKCWLKMYIL